MGVIDFGTLTNSDLSPVASVWVPGLSSGSHGNSVAGVLAATANNGEGLTGMLWNTKLYYCQTGALDALLFACMTGLVKAGVRVINYSRGNWVRDACPQDPWTCPLPAGWADKAPALVAAWEQELSAISKVAGDNWILVQAAGNEALSDSVPAAASLGITAPSLADRILVVGATTIAGKLSLYSNGGDLHIAAPGGAGPGGTNMLLLGAPGTVSDKAGTSFAAPLVAGAAVLAWSVNPKQTAAEVVTAVLKGSQGWAKTATDGSYTYPLLDTLGAVKHVIDACTAKGSTFNPATHQCTTAGCTPKCAGKACGSDGCGGTCGTLLASACAGTTLQMCQGGKIASVDCAATGGTCGPHPKGGAYCLAAPNAAPSGAILSPGPWAKISGPFEIAIQAEDDDSVIKTTIKVGNLAGEVLSDSADHADTDYVWRKVDVDPTGWAKGNYWVALWVSDGIQAVEGDVIGIQVGTDPGCVPDCAGKECGPDGCGGECKPGCPPGEICGKAGNAGTCLIIKSDMVTVPAGPFWMGCNAVWDQSCNADEKPQHEVVLDGFEIDLTEVTVSGYAACVSAGGCLKPSASSNYFTPEKTQHPVNYVTWYDATAYCAWMGKRLCTEAEWEKAARGGCELYPFYKCDVAMPVYPWGNEPASCAYAVMSGCGGDTMPVGSKPAGASPYGVLDMAGNVREWTADWYSSGYYAVGPKDNPQGPESGSFRVLRGGSFANTASILRAGNRNYDAPVNAVYNIGFRCCRSIP